MRELTGDVRLVAIPGGYGIEAIGLHAPAPLLATLGGQPVPDLSGVIGQVVTFVGALEAPTGNLGQLRLHPIDISIPQVEPALSRLWGVISGHLGGKPEANRKNDPDWVSGSLAYHSQPGRDGSTSWLKLTARTYLAVCDQFSLQETGTPIVAQGAIETYEYDGKPRTQLELRWFGRLPTGGGSNSAKPTAVLLSSGAGASTDALSGDSFVEG